MPPPHDSPEMATLSALGVSRAWLLLLVPQVDLVAVVGPAAKLHDARLLVEREVLHVHLAGRVVDGGRPPLHQARVEQRRLRRQRHLEVAVGAGRKEEKRVRAIDYIRKIERI